MPVNAHETKPDMAKPDHTKQHSGDHHSHPSVEIPAGQPVPTVNLVIHPDAMKGWNLEVKVAKG